MSNKHDSRHIQCHRLVQTNVLSINEHIYFSQTPITCWFNWEVCWLRTLSTSQRLLAHIFNRSIWWWLWDSSVRTTGVLAVSDAAAWFCPGSVLPQHVSFSTPPSFIDVEQRVVTPLLRSRHRGEPSDVHTDSEARRETGWSSMGA